MSHALLKPKSADSLFSVIVADALFHCCCFGFRATSEGLRIKNKHLTSKLIEMETKNETHSNLQKVNFCGSALSLLADPGLCYQANEELKREIISLKDMLRSAQSAGTASQRSAGQSNGILANSTQSGNVNGAGVSLPSASASGAHARGTKRAKVIILFRFVSYTSIFH
jgi:hypothetical protein